MKIGLIIHELLIEGGGERQIVCLAQALGSRGHQVTLFTSAYDRANCFPEICQTFNIVEVGRGAVPWLRKPLFVRGYLDMMRLAKEVQEKHDIWNPQHWPAQWGAVWLKRKLGGSVIWMCNDVPDCYANATRPRTVKKMILAPLFWLYYLYDRRQNRKVDLTLLVSDWAERDYQAIYQGATGVLRSGADPARFVPGGDRTRIRARFGFADDEFVLLWLGIFMPHRRLQDAVEAVSRLASQGVRVRLLLAGSDRSYPEYVLLLKTLARSLGVEPLVTFTGKVADEEIRDFYSACDAFVFPNDQQTWGLAVFEAMACGRPVLVSRGAGAHEVLTDNVNAILFPPRNPELLAEKIKLLLTQIELRDRIAQTGMNFARSTYNWDRYAEHMCEICARLAASREADVLPTAAAAPSVSS